MATPIQQLAQPKPNRLRYPDRRSVYWLDELPPKTTSPTTKIVSSPSSRLSPEWDVSEWALRAVPSERLCSLAKPRQTAVGWQPDRSLLFPLSRATQKAVATSRICQLAQPKRKQVTGGSGHKPRPVPMTHMPCRASAHIELLATPKHEHPKFEGERSVCWPISRASRNYIASQRLLELSSPKERKALFEGYNPYIVSRAARSASPSPRIQQLCLPLPRKCCSK
ncbi:theg spermatid protein [Scomber japonicus]|uniref:theg spermatid protein n=1 Tax=Scomber japonicus TaxID=13676 RepID=UPI002306414B|nr:theg spermatid protein [Scomber japonicus]